MKGILLSLAGLMAADSAAAQTNAPPFAEAAMNKPASTNSPGAFSASALSTDWMIVPFVIFSTDHHRYGAGVALLHEVTPNLGAGMRLDYLNGAIWMPSVALQLQAPLRVSPTITLVPFTFTGAAVPLGGLGSGSATALLGAGLAVRMGARIDVVWDIERWTGMDGIQFRLGLIWKF